MKKRSHARRKPTARLFTVVILGLLPWLPVGCIGPEKPLAPPSLYAIEIIPVGVHTNIYIAPAPGREYGVVTDNLGLLYLQGLLPAEDDE